MIRVLVLFMFIIPITVFGDDTPALPFGWELPSEELLYNGRDSNSPTLHAKVMGDLDGDGTQDIALLLVKLKGKKYAQSLWIYLSSSPKTPFEIQIANGKVIVEYLAGIDLVPSGPLSNYCMSFTYARCCVDNVYGPRPPPQNIMQNQGVQVFDFKWGGVGFVYYWDSDEMKFNEFFIHY